MAAKKTTKDSALKTLVQKLWAFYDANKINRKIVSEVYPGITVTLDYYYEFHPLDGIFYEAEYLEAKVNKKSADIKLLTKAMGNIDIEDVVQDNFCSDDLVPAKEQNKLNKDFSKLISQLPDGVSRKLGYFHNYETFEELWNKVDSIVNYVEPPKPVFFSVSNDYDAEIVKGSKTIQVGCQKIKVDDIRKLLEKIDEVNN